MRLPLVFADVLREAGYIPAGLCAGEGFTGA
jgi:hypothetical protein